MKAIQLIKYPNKLAEKVELNISPLALLRYGAKGEDIMKNNVLKTQLQKFVT